MVGAARCVYYVVCVLCVVRCMMFFVCLVLYAMPRLLCVATFLLEVYVCVFSLVFVKVEVGGN